MLNELTPVQKKLASFMSDLSELAYSAAWMKDLEFSLWEAVLKGPRKYGRLDISQEQIDKLSKLSKECDGWISFHDQKEEIWVQLNKWENVFAARFKNNK